MLSHHYTRKAHVTADRPCADEALQCRDCFEPFMFTTGEQRFYSSRDLAPPPAMRSLPSAEARRTALAIDVRSGASEPQEARPRARYARNSWGERQRRQLQRARDAWRPSLRRRDVNVLWQL